MKAHTHKHTSGPWHLGRRAGNPAIYSQDGTEIAEILQGLTPEWRENARLIAAAPDLLAALRFLMREARAAGIIPQEPCMQKAAHAIAKAERGAE